MVRVVRVVRGGRVLRVVRVVRGGDCIRVAGRVIYGAPAPAWATDNTINFSSPTVKLGDTLTTHGRLDLGPPLGLSARSSRVAPSRTSAPIHRPPTKTLAVPSRSYEFLPELGQPRITYSRLLARN